jgi:predicted nucleic acid-binding protein
MKVLVDTSIWSLALRRKTRSASDTTTSALAALIQDGRAVMIGPIRQELLSGIRERTQFDRLREHLHAFSDVEITVDDYEDAATFYNQCQSKGVQGSNTDFLICAVAARNDFTIFTADRDFSHFAKILPITLHAAER